MPDQAFLKLEAAGFRADLQGETIAVRLQNHAVRRSEVAEVLGCEAANLTRRGDSVEVSFGSMPNRKRQYSQVV